MFKSCTLCRIGKNHSEFSKDKDKKDGIKSSCKECQKKVYEEKKQSISKQRSENYQVNREKILARNKAYHQKTQYVKNRRIKDPCFRIAQNLRSRISKYLSNTLSDVSAIRNLGCSIQELKTHLELQFKTDMSWENYGQWQIDHIVPLASVNSEEDLIALCHYSNLQPLWSWQNQSKGKKVA